MTALAIEWLWWVFATFGLVGLVAFWFGAPTAAALALKAVLKFFELLLSYRIGCALLAAIAAGLIVDHKRHAYDDEQFAKQTAAFEAAQIERDQSIERKTRERVLAELPKQAKRNAETDEKVKEFIDVLPPPPPTGNVFRIGDSDAKRLCIIAYGKAGCGPDSRKGMPEARRSVGGAKDSRIGFPHSLRRIIGDD